MTRRQRVAVTVFVIVAAALATAITIRIVAIQRAETRLAASPSYLRPSTIQGRIDLVDLAQSHIDEIQTFQTMLNTARTAGQPTGQFVSACRAAVADYNATAVESAPYWPPYFDYPLDPSKECAP